MKHKHHDLIAQWIKDTSQKVWVWKEHDGGYWGETPTPRWLGDCTYKIQENKPTQPPARKVSFFDGGIEFDINPHIILSIDKEQTGFGWEYNLRINVQNTNGDIYVYKAMKELIETRLKPLQDI